MSEFYKKKRNLIIKSYKYLGLAERVSFYFCRISMIVLALVLCDYLSILTNTEKNKEGSLTIILLVGTIFVFYCISKSDKKEHQEGKMCAVLQFVKEPDINVEIVDGLIEEIERYIKRMKIFATWITGLSATFIILLATLTTNFFIKIFDVYLKVISTEELVSMIENIGRSGYVNELVLDSLYVGGMLLLIFIIINLIIYNLFALFTFVKQQILVFLLDVRYEILANINQTDNKKVIKSPVKSN